MRQKTKLDFSRYRTADLVQTIADIINMPHAFRSIITWAFYGTLTLVILSAIFLGLTGNLKMTWTFLFGVYAIPAGFFGGVALGIAEFNRRSLGNMTKLVDLLLETTKQVARDSGGFLAGEKQVPHTRDLVEDVYHHLILVALKLAVVKIFGFLGRPVYWFYHFSLNQFVRSAIRLIPKYDTQITQNMATAAKGVSDNEGIIVARLQWSQDRIQALGGWVKLFVMIPCYIVLGVVMLLILLPIALAWYFVMPGTPEPGVVETAMSSLLERTVRC